MPAAPSNVEDPAPSPRRRRGRPAGREASPESRLGLLDAAERLFADRGFFGVTTRQVALAAAVNDAMIYYHFDNKQGLFEAVFERRAKLLHRARHDSMLSYVAGSNGALTLEGVIGSFVDPMIDLSENGGPGWKSYFALVAQIDNAPWGREIIHKYFDADVYELVAIIRQTRPGVPDAELFWAFSFMVGSLMMALAETKRVDRLSDGLCQANDLEAVRGRLVHFCVGGFHSVIELAAGGTASTKAAVPAAARARAPSS